MTVIRYHRNWIVSHNALRGEGMLQWQSGAVMTCSKSFFWDATLPGLFALAFLFHSLSVCLTFWPETLASAAQCLKHSFPPFCLELSLAKPGFEQLCRWAPQGEWRDKASSQGLATCSPASMPLHQISVIPTREAASNGRSSMGRNKEKNKEVEVRGGLIWSTRTAKPTAASTALCAPRSGHGLRAAGLPLSVCDGPLGENHW